MDKSLQRRLLIAIIIVAIIVIVVPMFFGHSIQRTVTKPADVIPPAPPAPIVNEPAPIKDEAPVNLQTQVPVAPSSQSSAVLSADTNGLGLHGLAPIAQTQSPKPQSDSAVPGLAAIAPTDHESAPVVPGASPAVKSMHPKKKVVVHHHVIVKEHKPIAHHEKNSKHMTSKEWVVQTASVPIKIHAERIAHELRQKGFPAHVQAALVGKYITYRVYVGPYRSQEIAKEKSLEIKHKTRLNGFIHTS